jgi:hypothetical protein
MMAGRHFAGRRDAENVTHSRRICGSPRFALFYMAAWLGSGSSQKESRASVASQNSVFRINIAFATVSKPFPASSGTIQSVLVF